MAEYFIHESSYADPDSEIGSGTKIWHFCHLMARSRIGSNCILGQNVFVASDVTIGNNVKIQNNVSIYTGVVIEDDVFLGPSMVFTNVVNPRSHIQRKDEFKLTRVCRGATIGANATIICGIELGSYSFIGAGAVVTHDVPPYALVYGNPARLHGWMCHCGIQLNFAPKDGYEFAVCDRCGSFYMKEGNLVHPVSVDNTK